MQNQMTTAGRNTDEGFSWHVSKVWVLFAVECGGREGKWRGRSNCYHGASVQGRALVGDNTATTAQCQGNLRRPNQTEWGESWILYDWVSTPASTSPPPGQQ